MDKEKLANLIQKKESSSLDFKREPYWDANGKFHGNKGCDLIKDMLAMANSVRTESAFIVFGVSDDGTKVGINFKTDEQKLRNLLKTDLFDLHLEWSYYELETDGNIFGVIEIPLQQKVPIVLQREYKGMPVGVIYERYGTTNNITTPSKYFEKNSSLKEGISVEIYNLVERWLHVFESHGVSRSELPSIFSELELKDLKSHSTLASALNPWIINWTCEQLNVCRVWLETGKWNAQKTIDIDKLCGLMDKLKAEGKYFELFCVSDRDEPYKLGEWGILFILKIDVGITINNERLESFIPSSQICFSPERVRIVNSVLKKAEDLNINTSTFTLSNKGMILSEMTSGEDFYVNFREKYRELLKYNPWFITRKYFLALPKNFEYLTGTEKFRALVLSIEEELDWLLRSAKDFFESNFFVSDFKEIDKFNNGATSRPFRHVLYDLMENVKPYLKCTLQLNFELEEVFNLSKNEVGMLHVLASLKTPLSLSEMFESALFMDQYNDFIDQFNFDHDVFEDFVEFMKPLYFEINNNNSDFYELAEQVEKVEVKLKQEQLDKEESKELKERLNMVSDTCVNIATLKSSFSFLIHPKPKEDKYFQPNTVIFLVSYMYILKDYFDMREGKDN